jgi:alpha/beta hydrolase fold
MECFDMPITHHPEHLVDRAAMVAVRLMLKSMKGSVNGPSARKTFDEIMVKVPSASGVSYEAETVGGVPGWWCRPKEAATGAAILYLHGGGYVVGAAEAYQHFVGQIARRANVAVFVPDYRLAPEFPFPAAVEDAQAAYAGLIAHGIGNIALAGDSAGGGDFSMDGPRADRREHDDPRGGRSAIDTCVTRCLVTTVSRGSGYPRPTGVATLRRSSRLTTGQNARG